MTMCSKITLINSMWSTDQNFCDWYSRQILWYKQFESSMWARKVPKTGQLDGPSLCSCTLEYIWCTTLLLAATDLLLSLATSKNCSVSSYFYLFFMHPGVNYCMQTSITESWLRKHFHLNQHLYLACFFIFLYGIFDNSCV